jgi:hypothetical protein
MDDEPRKEKLKMRKVRVRDDESRNIRRVWNRWTWERV